MSKASPTPATTHPFTFIEIDSTDAPRFVRFVLSGEWPSLERQRAIRDELVSGGRLTAESRVLVDVRGIATEQDVAAFAVLKDGIVARVQAFLVASSQQHQFARRFKQAAITTLVEIFVDEQHALEWLWNSDPDY